MIEDKDEVAAYMNAVKAVFEDKSDETYDEFLKTLNNFKAETIDATYAKARFTKLFKGHQDLILGFNKFIPNNYEIILPLDTQPQGGADISAFIKLVEHEFVDKKDKFQEFLQIRNQICAPRLDSKDVKARVKELFKGHPNLMLGFNQFSPVRCRNPLRFVDDFYKSGKRKKRVPVTDSLPWDVLYNISERLDFDDLVQFSGVCKYWRAFHKIYWRNFLASQEPLLVQRCFNAMKSFSFISIIDQNVYHSKTINCFRTYAYSGSSSGYMIMTGENNNFVLLNPFTRIKKEIKTSAFQVKCADFAYHVLLAFVKGSEEFVLVVLCKSYSSLHVYQSRNLGWVTYSTMGNPWKVADFVVLNNTIYVITDKGKIGTLNLNYANIKFLELKNTPFLGTYMTHLRLVTCDGQLLVVYSSCFGWLTKVPSEILKVYRIDISTMNYVDLKTLGDIALFYASGRNCYALSNPGELGYESNSMYFIDSSSTKCNVFTRGNIKKIYARNVHMERPYLLDWCFRHLQYEIDYSLVE